MRVVGKEVLAEYAKSHADSKDALAVWIRVATSAIWTSIADLRKTYPHADFVKPYTVFNIKGNRYRLVTLVDYKQSIIYIEKCLTHAEYEKDKWNS
jgi:mRNA interferase HigB